MRDAVDLRIYRTFTRDLTGIERQYIADLMRAFRTWRVEMIDLVDTYGLGPMTQRGLEASLQALVTSTGKAVLDYGPLIIDTAIRYMERQLAALKRAAPRVAPAFVPSPSNTMEISQNLGAASTAWIDALRARMVAEIARLKLSGDDVDPIARLLALNVVDGRASVWRHGRNSMMSETIMGIWGAANGISHNIASQVQEQTSERYQRQAIAAIDERTTDCCLRVHGQVVAFDQPFRLTGTPRFADRMMGAPFHWYCRTAEAIYHPTLESIGESTGDMRDAARDEMTARDKTGTRVEIHPAHATSSR